MRSNSHDKENIIPLSKSRRTKATRADHDYDDGEGLVGLSGLGKSKASGMSSSKAAGRHATSTSAPKKQQSTSSSESAPLKRMREVDDEAASDEEEDRKTRRERILEEKLAVITKERDQVQSQFDDMKEMRETKPERLLTEWKKLSDQRDAKAEDLIRKLKSELSSGDNGGNDTGTAPSSSSDGAFSRQHTRNADHNDQLQSSGEVKKLKEEVARLKQELATTSSALRGRTVQGTGSIGSIDEKAIRRLYEDLTGLVINKVEPAISREKDYYRSFHAIFASDGFYNLEMKLEESESSLNSSDGSTIRQDLVYVPAMDPDRDAEIIASGKLPDYLLKSLRFERSTAVRFMNTLHRRLDKASKR